MKKKSIATYRVSTKVVGLLLSALLMSNSVVLAGNKSKHQQPDELGPYSIGHTTVILNDTTRNNDGSAPAIAPGRFLHLDVWYPTNVKTDDRILYDWNNPIYNDNTGGQTYPGLPDLAAMTWDGSLSSNAVTELAPLARRGKFPLLIASHGNLVGSAKNMPDTLEMLASHGYVIASIEHTGNSDAQFQADWLGNRIGLDIGPNPNLGSGVILQRTKDVSFVIDQVLEGFLEQKTGIEFTGHIDQESIGVLGFSLGGMTSLATVAGIGVQNHSADRRVKAALMVGGSNYGLLMNTDDYANAKVPLMFLGNDTGVVYDKFNEFTGTKSKYIVDIADFNHHVGGYQTSWCQDFVSSMESVDPNVFPAVFGNPTSVEPSDFANFIFPATFYWSSTGPRNSGIYDYCESEVFDNISDEVLVDVLFFDSSILGVRDELIDSMPLKPKASIAEITRTTNRYSVSFFNSYLKKNKRYKRYLTDSRKNQKDNPLVHLEVSCMDEKSRPIDLLATDKLSFVPVHDSGYEVSLTSGASLYPVGSMIDVTANGVNYLDTAGFSFLVPGMNDRVENLFVSKNGVITTRTTSDIGSIDDNGSPWYMKGHLLLSGQFTIGALMKELTSNGNDVFADYDQAEERVVITYQGIMTAGTTEPNTLQIAIHSDGTIEMIIQELSNTGANYSPSILGTIGIAGGHTRIKDLRKVRSTNFSKLRNNGSKFMKFGPEKAIFEQFYTGTESGCSKNNHKNK